MKKIIITSLFLLNLLLFFSFVAPKAKAQTTTRPLVGALRWDGYYGSKADEVATQGNDPIGAGVVEKLSPSDWHYRLPFFGQVVSDTAITLPGYSQAIIDQEIAYAKNAGIDYWIFDRYFDSVHLSDALHYYLSSSHANDIKFTFMCDPGTWGIPVAASGTAYDFNTNEQRFFSLMKQPNFQTVLGGRPLIYMGFVSDSWMTTYWGNYGGFKGMISRIRKDAQTAGLANPYIVIMDFTPQTAHNYVVDDGADAISSYAAVTSPTTTETYQDLVTFAENFWASEKSTGSNTIPTVMTGWDNRPMKVAPQLSWYPIDSNMNLYYQAGTPAQIAAHLADGLNFVKNNPTVDPANTLVIYAWDEILEGGWLIPTLGDGTDGTAKLDAVKTVLTDNIPVGTLESISTSGLVQGWMADKDNPVPYVGIYIDGHYGTGTFLAYVHATISRPDVLAAIGYGATSGFEYQIPSQYLTDGKTHKIYVYGIDADWTGVPVPGGTNPLLAQSGMAIPIATGKPGDLNNDGKVDIYDYNILVANYGHPYTVYDYNTLVANYGR